MLNPKPEEKSGLEKAIDTVLSEMAGVSTDSEEHARMTNELLKLYPLREHDKSFLSRISPDTVLIVVGNLVGIGAIVGYERAHVATSKALNFVMKLR